MIIECSKTMSFRKSLHSTKIIRYLSTKTTVDEHDVHLFSKLSSKWWDENGPFKPLHSFNRLRIPFIREGLIQNGSINENYIRSSKVLKDLKILDVGCGGGLLCEPLSRLGAEVTGIDKDTTALKEAQRHMSVSNLENISYIDSSIEEFADRNYEKFDAITASEVVEHVSNKDDFIAGCVKCLKPGGAIFITTLNQTLLANILGIWLAESLEIAPKGLHQIDKFIQPHDLQRILEKNNCQTRLIHGLRYLFLTNTWSWTSDESINYALYAVKTHHTLENEETTQMKMTKSSAL